MSTINPIDEKPLNPYELLGVPPTATADEITAAYRRLAMAEHPDRGGSTERMTEINLAYERLSDPQARAEYNRSLLAPSADPLLDLIKQNIADKSRAEIVLVRQGIAELIRSGRQDGARAQRHHRELGYLDHLLGLELDAFEAQMAPLRAHRIATVLGLEDASSSEHSIAMSTGLTIDQVRRARVMGGRAARHCA